LHWRLAHVPLTEQQVSLPLCPRRGFHLLVIILTLEYHIDPGCVAHNPSTHIDLDDGFGPYRFPPLSTSPSLLSPMEIDAPPETSLSANSKKRYSTIPAAAIEAARSSAPAASGSASKRNSTIKVVGQPDPESPGSEAAKLGGRVVQQKVSGNWVVYDYTPTKSPADGDAK